MLARFLLVASVYVFYADAAAAVTDAARPECVSKCWDYTQYVSQSCMGDTMCLCNDSEYQNAVYQCLYSQCTTAQFASALHHTLGICHSAQEAPCDQSEENQGSQPSPPHLLRQDASHHRNKKRAAPYASASNSVNYSVTRSAGPSVTRSAGPSVTRSVVRSAAASALPTQSVSRGLQSVSASAYGGPRGTPRASPTLSVGMPLYRR